MMSHIKNKKILLALFSTMLFVGIVAFAFSNKTKVDDFNARIESTDYVDLYTKDITLGNTTLKMNVKSVTYKSKDNGDWYSGEYRFYSTDDEHPITTVASLIPPEYEDGVDPLFSLKDISGDGVPEVFIKTEASASGVRAYEILRLQNDTLVNIREEGTENDWVIFDEIEYKDGYTYATWHGRFERGMTQFKLQGNILMRVRIMVLHSDGSDSGGCHVRQVNVRQDQSVSFTEIEYKENCNIWTDDLYPYFDSTPNIEVSTIQDFELPFSGTLDEVLIRKKSYICNYAESAQFGSASGSVYVSSGRARGSFSGTALGESAQSEFLYDGQRTYVWIHWPDTISQGKKTAALFTHEGKDSIGTLEISESLGEMSCRPEHIEESYFSLPTDVILIPADTE